MAGKEEQTQHAGSPEKLINNKSCWNSHQVHFSLPSAEPTPASKSGCQHINKAIDATSVRKAIIRAGGFASLRCVSCVADSASDSEEIEKDLSLCLKCGVCNCDDHLLKHFEIPRSDPHTLFVKIEDWSVRCCKCDIDVPVENNGKLKEGINILKQEQRKPSRVKTKPKKATFEMTDSKPSSVASVDVPCKTTVPLTKTEHAQNPKKFNVMIYGIPMRDDENLKDIIKYLASKLGVNLKDLDIIAADRLSSESKIPPVIVKLHCGEKKAQLIKGAIKKKPTAELLGFNNQKNHIYVGEHRTLIDETLMKKAEMLRKNGLVKYIFPKNGEIFAREADNSPLIKITCEENIKEIAHSIQANRKPRPAASLPSTGNDIPSGSVEVKVNTRRRNQKNK